MKDSELKIKDVHLAFVFSGIIEASEEEAWGKWCSLIEKESTSRGYYYWELTKRGVKLRKSEESEQLKYPKELSDFITVEKFYLLKQPLRVKRGHVLISRFVPSKDIKVIIKIPNSKQEYKSECIIISLYKDLGVATLLVSFHFKEIDVDELIYIKSLKWHSAGVYERGPKVYIEIPKKNSGGEVYLSEVFDRVWGHIFEGKLEARTSSDIILDLIEIRDEEFCKEIFSNGGETCCKAIYGIAYCDEGYRLIPPEVAKEYCFNRKNFFQTREYFRYYFSPTSVLGLLSSGYKSVKEEHTKKYCGRFGNFEPIGEYIGLVSNIATLSDGLALAGEATLVRYSILRDVYLRIKELLDGGPSSGSFNRLKELKEKIATKMSKVELLTENVVWLGLFKEASEMFEHEPLKKILQEQFFYIDSLITGQYNENIQKRLLWLTVILVILGFINIFILLDHKSFLTFILSVIGHLIN